MRVDLASGTPAELALPPGPATRGVVMFPDIGGLRPLFDELAARLANEQHWAVCAVEPFPGQHLPDVDARFTAVPGLDDARLLGDARAAAGLLTERAACQRVGVIGFCMGGMYTLKVAASGYFDRAVAFYGMIRLPLVWRGAHQAEPLELLTAEEAKPCPTLAIVGGRDPYTPAEDVKALAGVGPAISVVEYPEAEHGFVHDPDRPAHRPGDAADAWAKAVAFLE